MPKTYIIKEKIAGDLVNQLLHNRGITEEKAQKAFLNPHFEDHLHDPFLLPDMDKAVDRILSAIDRGEKVGIWSDYDADGIPGGALLHDFFKSIGFIDFINYIPDRLMEGYGLNSEGLEKMREEKVTLLITIDCGIRDIEHIEIARKFGMEVIVTDHHEPGPELPQALAIVNHKIKGSKYPEEILCGSGIVWKIIEAILQKKRHLLKEGQEKWFLDLAGIATLSDMVPLIGENRAIAHFGLKVLRQTKRPGLKKLYSMLKINKEYLTEDDIGFLITPRINAASRMGKPRDVFDLLTAQNEGEAEAKAIHLNKINQERKGVVAGIVKEALKIIRSKIENYGEQAVIVAGNPAWRPSLLGLAANSIAEEYKKPVFLWGRENGNGIKGSCRSDGVTDLVNIMERAKEAFSEFGGHKFSGGFSVDFEKIETLEDSIIKATNTAINRSISENTIFADAELKVQDVNKETADAINNLAPFGVGNEKPTFILYNIIPEKIQRFGKEQNHLSVRIRDGARTAKAINFFAEPDKFGDNLKEGMTTNLVANLEMSYFMNRPEVRLRIIDFFK